MLDQPNEIQLSVNNTLDAQKLNKTLITISIFGRGQSIVKVYTTLNYIFQSFLLLFVQ